MANTTNPNGFKFVKNMYGEAVILEMTNGSVAIKKGDTIVSGSGVALIGTTSSTFITGVAAADCAIGGVLSYYPCLPGYVFETEITTYTVTTHLHGQYDVAGGTGVQYIDAGAHAEAHVVVLGLVEDGENVTGAYARVEVMFIASTFTANSGHA